MHEITMKKTKIIINVIASWQLLLAAACLFLIIVRTHNIGFWGNDNWYIDYTLGTIGHPVFSLWDAVFQIIFSLCFVLYFVSSVSNSIGLLLRKSWAFWFSHILLSVVIALCLAIIGFDINDIFQTNNFNVLEDIIYPLVMILALMVANGLPFIYLGRESVKEYLKPKVQINVNAQIPQNKE
jgi:hypothetical protein